MKIILSAAVVLLLIAGVADAATAACDGPCAIPLGDMNCTEAIAQHDFDGDCCSLQESPDGSNCTLVTTSECYIQLKGDTGCHTDDEGNEWCVIPGVSWSAYNTEEPCPASDFSLPMKGNQVPDQDGDEEDEGQEP